MDRDPARLALASRLGATEVIDVTATRNVVRAVHKACGGPADVTIECTGDPGVIRQAIDAVGMLGVCCLVGTAAAGTEFRAAPAHHAVGETDPGHARRRGAEPGARCRPCSGSREQGRFPFAELIEFLPFADAEAAMAASADRAVVKPVLRMS